MADFFSPKRIGTVNASPPTLAQCLVKWSPSEPDASARCLTPFPIKLDSIGKRQVWSSPEIRAAVLVSSSSTKRSVLSRLRHSTDFALPLFYEECMLVGSAKGL